MGPTGRGGARERPKLSPSGRSRGQRTLRPAAGGAPVGAQRSGSNGERRRKGAPEAFALRRKRRAADFAPCRRGPRWSPAKRVQRGEEAQGSAQSFRPQAEAERSGLCALPSGPPLEPSEVGPTGRGGARERPKLSPSGGSGGKRTLRPAVGAPVGAQRSGSNGERRRKGAPEAFALRRKQREADFAPTTGREESSRRRTESVRPPPCSCR